MKQTKKIIERLRRIDKLVQLSATGAPKQLASMLDISERQLYNYICLMRNELNAPIKYNKHRQTYYYLEKGKLKLEWEEKTEIIEIK